MRIVSGESIVFKTEENSADIRRGEIVDFVDNDKLLVMAETGEKKELNYNSIVGFNDAIQKKVLILFITRNIIFSF
jgi:hypothetical protein